jgi:hypothetical protein
MKVGVRVRASCPATEVGASGTPRACVWGQAGGWRGCSTRMHRCVVACCMPWRPALGCTSPRTATRHPAPHHSAPPRAAPHHSAPPRPARTPLPRMQRRRRCAWQQCPSRSGVRRRASLHGRRAGITRPRRSSRRADKEGWGGGVGAGWRSTQRGGGGVGAGWRSTQRGGVSLKERLPRSRRQGGRAAPAGACPARRGGGHPAARPAGEACPASCLPPPPHPPPPAPPPTGRSSNKPRPSCERRGCHSQTTSPGPAAAAAATAAAVAPDGGGEARTRAANAATASTTARRRGRRGGTDGTGAGSSPCSALLLFGYWFIYTHV